MSTVTVHHEFNASSHFVRYESGGQLEICDKSNSIAVYTQSLNETPLGIGIDNGNIQLGEISFSSPTVKHGGRMSMFLIDTATSRTSHKMSGLGIIDIRHTSLRTAIEPMSIAYDSSVNAVSLTFVAPVSNSESSAHYGITQTSI